MNLLQQAWYHDSQTTFSDFVFEKYAVSQFICLCEQFLSSLSFSVRIVLSPRLKLGGIIHYINNSCKILDLSQWLIGKIFSILLQQFEYINFSSYFNFNPLLTSPVEYFSKIEI